VRRVALLSDGGSLKWDGGSLKRDDGSLKRDGGWRWSRSLEHKEEACARMTSGD